MVLERLDESLRRSTRFDFTISGYFYNRRSNEFWRNETKKSRWFAYDTFVFSMKKMRIIRVLRGFARNVGDGRTIRRRGFSDCGARWWREERTVCRIVRKTEIKSLHWNVMNSMEKRWWWRQVIGHGRISYHASIEFSRFSRTLGIGQRRWMLCAVNGQPNDRTRTKKCFIYFIINHNEYIYIVTILTDQYLYNSIGFARDLLANFFFFCLMKILIIIIINYY